MYWNYILVTLSGILITIPFEILHLDPRFLKYKLWSSSILVPAYILFSRADPIDSSLEQYQRVMH